MVSWLILIAGSVRPFAEDHSNESTILYNITASNDNPPFTFIDAEADLPGILSEMILPIFKRSGYPYQSIVVPPHRTNTMISQGDLHVDITSSSWFVQVPDFFFISYPFMTFAGYIAFRPEDAKMFQSHDAIYDPSYSIGLIRGYYYPDKDRINFIEAGNERALVKMLATNRLDAIIVNDLNLAWFNHELNLNIMRGPQYLSGPLSLRISKTRPDLLPVLNEAIKALEQEGHFDRVLRKYQSVSHSEMTPISPYVEPAVSKK